MGGERLKKFEGIYWILRNQVAPESTFFIRSLAFSCFLSPNQTHVYQVNSLLGTSTYVDSRSIILAVHAASSMLRLVPIPFCMV